MNSPPFINELLFFALFMLVAYYIVAVFARPQSFVTFPVLAASVWLTYFIPQAAGILYNPIWIPSAAYADGFWRTMVMAILCVLMGAWGWASGPRASAATRKGAPRRISTQWILFWGTVYTLGAMACWLYIASLTGGLARYYSIDGAYQLDWIGIEVIVSFLRQLLSIVGTILIATALFRKPTPLRVTLLLIAIAPTVADIAILNRRSAVIYLAFSLALPLFFVRRWVPPRNLLLAAMVVGACVVFVFPVVRGAFLFGSDKQIDRSITEIIMDDVFGGGGQKELNNSVVIIGAHATTGYFNFGGEIYNSWVKTSIPRTFVGESVKEGLTVETRSFASVTYDAYYWIPVWYQSISLAARIFASFWFLGSLVFFMMGYATRYLYSRAMASDELFQLYYMITILFVPHWIAIGLMKMPRDLLATAVLVQLVWLTGQLKTSRRATRLPQLPPGRRNFSRPAGQENLAQYRNSR